MQTVTPPIATFIVRVNANGDGSLTGTIERVRTGERHRFEGPDALGRIIHRVVEAEKVSSECDES